MHDLPQHRAYRAPRRAGGIARHEFYSQAKILDEDLPVVKQAAKDYGVEGIDSPYFVDYVDGVFRKIKASETDPVVAGEKMAQFGTKLDAAIAKLATREARKSANYSIADAVTTLEEFKPEEFKSPNNSLGKTAARRSCTAMTT